MQIWITQDGEPIPTVDKNVRDWRTTMLSKALVARGHKVLWWASTFDHVHKCHRFKTSRTIEIQPKFEVHLLHGPGYGYNKSPKRFWHQRTLAAAFAREAIKLEQPDLVFCSVPTLELAEQALQYGQQRHLPVVVDVRDPWPDLYLNIFPSKFRWFAKRLFAVEFARARYIFQATNGIIAVSDAYLNWAIGYAERVRHGVDYVFPLGYSSLPTRSQQEQDERISKLREKLQLPPDGLIITFIGIFGASYDLETVVRAATYIQNTRPDLRIYLVLAGDGDQSDKLHRIGEGVPSIIFTGWLDQDDIVTLMRLSSVGLAAYAQDALQSLPNKPFEYMSAGLPLLSSLSGELEQIIAVEKIGVQYNAGNAQSLAEKVIWLAEHPNEREQMGVRAYQLFNERFRADIIYPQMAAHLENIMNQGINHPNLGQRL